MLASMIYTATPKQKTCSNRLIYSHVSPPKYITLKSILDVGMSGVTHISCITIREIYSGFTNVQFSAVYILIYS